MNLPLISHEAPMILSGKDKVDDFLFVLLHRYIDDIKYQEYVDSYRGFKIMDNSCFELGAALSNDLIREYYDRMKPDYFVLPDTLGDLRATIESSTGFMQDHHMILDHAMGVIQGDSIPEMIECYKFFDENLPANAMIGIPFCFNWCIKVKVDPVEHAWARVRLMKALEPHINKERKHHLLGTWSAFEFGEYYHYDWIYSLDTSNPIAAGLEGSRYIPGQGTTTKPKPKFDEFIDMLHVTSVQYNDIMYNVHEFKKIAKRRNSETIVMKNKADKINPNHYRSTDSFQVIDVIERWKLDFKRGNVVKYTLRAGQKSENGYSNIDKEIEDLTKAQWYLERAIKELKKQRGDTE